MATRREARSHAFPSRCAVGSHILEVPMPDATQLLERASDNREQAMRVRRLCQSVSAGDQADLESYAGGLEQEAADLERLASGLVGEPERALPPCAEPEGAPQSSV